MPKEINRIRILGGPSIETTEIYLNDILLTGVESIEFKTSIYEKLARVNLVICAELEMDALAKLGQATGVNS